MMLNKHNKYAETDFEAAVELWAEAIVGTDFFALQPALDLLTAEAIKIDDGSAAELINRARQETIREANRILDTMVNR